MKRILFLLLAPASLCFAQEYHLAPEDIRSEGTYAAPRNQTNNDPPLLEPNFLLPQNPDVNDYRPVVNAEGTMVIFERNATATPEDVKLHSLDLSTGDVQLFVTFASSRAAPEMVLTEEGW